MTSTLKVTKGDMVLEYSGTSAEDVREMMLNILHSRPQIKVAVTEPNETKKGITESALFIPIEEFESFKQQLPTKQDVINYIVAKPDFEHTNPELQEKFFGRHLKSREDKHIYNALDRILRDAKDIIAKEHSGTWKISGYAYPSPKTRVKVFKFVKSEGTTKPEK